MARGGMRVARSRYYRRRRFRRFFRSRRFALFRRRYRPGIRRPHSNSSNSIIMRPNFSYNFKPAESKSRYLVTFKFKDLQELDKFKTGLFGYYRFLRIYSKVYPSVSVLDSNWRTGTYLGVPWHRPVSDIVLQALDGDDILDLRHSKSVRCNQVMYMNVVPSVMINSNVAPSGTMQSIRYRPWMKIDPDGVDVEHYGIVFAFPHDIKELTYLIVSRVYVEIRGYSV
nr:MAG: capsid protein [Canine circovirus]